MIQFPANWRFSPLEDCMEKIIDYRGKTPQKTTSGIPLVTAKIVKSGRINFDDQLEYIADDDYENWMRRGLPKSGDIVVTTEAPLGEVAQLDARKVALAQRLIALRGKSNFLDNTYLKYLMMSDYVQEQLRERASGTTVLGIKQSELRRVTLALPPFPIQRRIAAILGRLDDKIEVNRRINRTLEAMAQALYQHWFVDFGPFQDGGLVESALGLIPVGWRVANLEDAFEVNPLRSLKKGQLAPYLDMASMPTSSARALDWIFREFNSGMRFMNGDVLVARITPCLENGKTAIVDFLADNEVGWGSTEYIVLRSKPPLPYEYAYLLARSPEFRAFAIQHMTGTSGRQRVSADNIKAYPVVVPPDDIAQEFGTKVKKSFQIMKQLDDESKKLAEIRDYLLPKLLAGEIGVAAADGEIAEAITL